MQKVPREIQKLIEEREKLRAQKQYNKSDAVRKHIETMGYQVIDQQEGTRLGKKEIYTAPRHSFLVLFGSGEVAPSAQKVHDRVLSGIGKDEPRIVIVSTPAGFQPNVKVVCEEIKDFFEQHLKNYHPQVQIVYANTLEQSNNPALLQPLESADYIFAGPGSPTYAVHHLQESLALAKIKERLGAGASLASSSAAAIAFSKFALPVYEIYKAGFDLYWEQGLNFYTSFLQELTIIPHFNNNEGGKKNDTSKAWMGKKRFEKMLKLLPPKHTVWGIDEHIAVIIDLQEKTKEVMGNGKLYKIKV